MIAIDCSGFESRLVFFKLDPQTESCFCTQQNKNCALLCRRDCATLLQVHLGHS